MEIPKTEFEILEKEIVHEYTSLDKLIHRRRFRILALKDDLDCYYDKFFWSGDDFTMRTDIPGHQVALSGKISLYDMYEYRFGKKLQKNEEIDLEVVWELNNSSQKAIPFFSTTIEEPTKVLIMILKIPPSSGIKKVVCYTSGTVGAKKPFESEELSRDSNGDYSWKIQNPKLLYSYEINWSF